MNDLKTLTLGTIYDILEEKTLDRAFDDNDDSVYLINNSDIDSFFPINL